MHIDHFTNAAFDILKALRDKSYFAATLLHDAVGGPKINLMWPGAYDLDGIEKILAYARFYDVPVTFAHNGAVTVIDVSAHVTLHGILVTFTCHMWTEQFTKLGFAVDRDPILVHHGIVTARLAEATASQ